MSKGLTKLQNEVMNGLFSGEGEDKTLAEAEISQSVYQRWLKSENWQQEFQLRIKKCKREAMLTIVTYQVTAAIKLILLMNCDKEQTARQACLDILQIETGLSKEKIDEQQNELNKLKLSAEAAAKITKILASEKVKDEKADSE